MEVGRLSGERQGWGRGMSRCQALWRTSPGIRASGTAAQKARCSAAGGQLQGQGRAQPSVADEEARAALQGSVASQGWEEVRSEKVSQCGEWGEPTVDRGSWEDSSRDPDERCQGRAGAVQADPSGPPRESTGWVKQTRPGTVAGGRWGRTWGGRRQQDRLLRSRSESWTDVCAFVELKDTLKE